MTMRRYDVKGTNDFLIAAVVLAGLSAWAVKDGWFPSARVLQRHPREIAAVAPTVGTLVEVRAILGQTVLSNQVVAVVQASEPTDRPGGDKTEIHSPAAGTILDIRAGRTDSVKAGDTILTVAPDDVFYPFNKSLAVLSFIGAIVCLIIHRAVR